MRVSKEVAVKRRVDRRRRRAAERLEAYVKLRSTVAYRTGDFGAQLGLAAKGSCVRTSDAAVRNVMRSAAIAAMGGRPAGAKLCHRCDTPDCVLVTHLFWGSQRDNLRDCVLKGRSRGGGLPAAERKLKALRRLL